MRCILVHGDFSCFCDVSMAFWCALDSTKG
nr:MAG TPA: hypothetical protein [Caudoviricetes sp.]